MDTEDDKAMMSEEAVVLRETAPMNILIVDDEPTNREACGELAQLTGMNATMVATAEEAIEILENTAVDIVLTDLMLPHTSGLELLKRVHDTHPNLPVIVLTQYGTIDSAVAATRMGAILRHKAFSHRRVARAPVASFAGRRTAAGKSTIARAVAHAAGVRRPHRFVREDAAGLQNDSEGKPARVPVLILGESGTGKELVARSVHYSGARKDRTFVPVDCS
jgi:two-component system, NtrC family, response regulator AtoC